MLDFKDIMLLIYLITLLKFSGQNIIHFFECITDLENFEMILIKIPLEMKFVVYSLVMKLNLFFSMVFEN
jgi:hypothetical protein